MMAQHSDQGGDDEGSSLRLVVLTVLPTAAAAVLAWWLLFPDRPRWMTVAVVLGAVVAGVALALLLVRPQLRDTQLRDTQLRDTQLRDTQLRDTQIRDTQRRDTPRREGPGWVAEPFPGDARQPPPGGWWSEPRAARPAPNHSPARPDRPVVEDSRRETAQLVLPVDGGAPPGGWWNQDSPHPPGRAGGPAHPAPRDLAELRDSARVVQCPRCGAFRIDVTHVGPGYAFHCRVDDHEWTWRPGTAWPVTVIASRRRTDR